MADLAETDKIQQTRLISELADARQQQRLYHQLFEHSLGLMCVHDLDGVLLLVNPAAGRSLGFESQAGVGVNMRCFLAPSAQPLFDAYLDRMRRNGSDSGLMRLVASDGTERIWLYRNVLYEEPGASSRVLGHAQDITDRIQAEEALKESERRFRSMADTAPVFIWMTDTAGRCEFVNKAWLDFSGRTLEEELGREWTTSFHPEDRDRGTADFRAAMAQRREFRAEYRMRRADGEYRWILDTGTPRFDRGGHFTGYIGSCVDVTEARQDREALRIARDELALRVAERTAELQQSNEALRRSDQLYQDLAEMSPVGIFRTNAAGQCLYLNQRASEILGMTVQEAGQGAWSRVLEPQDLKLLAAAWRKAVEGGQPGYFEHRIVRPDGSALWVLTHLAAQRGPEGSIAGCIGTVADISDRKRAEEENRKLEAQMQSAQRLQSLGILAGGLAHDFNNLLTVILGNARMARLDLLPEAPAVDRLAEIEKATSRAAELTSQILAYAGKGRFTLQPVNLSRLAGETANLLQAVISKKIAVLLNLEDPLDLIEADPAQIRQIAINLITNAAEAIGEDGGLIRVATGIVDADETYLSSGYFDDHLPAGHYVYLEVCDSGCGMHPETISKIFDPFFTTKFTGRGLGLAAVIGIVRAHHGALRVASEPGSGSTFRLLFPALAKREEERVEQPGRMPERANQGTILVVDDEVGMCNLARAILEKSGYTVLTAADGGDALRIFRRHAAEVAAVVLDLTMPVMNGEQTAAELRRLRADIPIILSSGYGEQETATSLAAKGLADFLQKPYEPADLTAALRRALGHVPVK